MLARLCCRCCLSVRPSVTTFTIRCVSKGLDRSGCFWAWMLPFAYNIHCTKEIQVGAYLKKTRALPSGLCPELWTKKISPWQVDRVVNKPGRRSSFVEHTYDGRRAVAARRGWSMLCTHHARNLLHAVVKVVMCSRGGGWASEVETHKNIDSVLHTKTTFQAHSISITSISITWCRMFLKSKH